MANLTKEIANTTDFKYININNNLNSTNNVGNSNNHHSDVANCLALTV